MRVLVTGATGFVGSYVARSLVSHGADVHVLMRNRSSVLDHLGAGKVLVADLTGDLNRLESAAYDVVVHAAGANDVDSTDPREALWATAWATRNLLHWCKAHGQPRILYVSTFQVYGCFSGEVSETTPVQCANDYALTHYFAEEYLRMVERQRGVKVIVVRPTNIYAAPLVSNFDRWTLVPACFCKEAFEQGTITLRSSGRQHRDFISAEDVGELIYMLCERFDAFAGRTLNLATGRSVTIRRVAKQAARIYEEEFGRPCRLLFLSNEPTDEQPLIVDTTVIASLRYSCRDRMEQTIREIYRFLRR